MPATAVETVAGTSRVFVVKNGRIEERIVTLAEKIDSLVELTSGVAAGEVVAADPRGRLVDGREIKSEVRSAK